MSDSVAFPSIWNVPYRRNEYFTGREDVLAHLHHSLQADNLAALTQPQSISGLGGIGKTQTALEFAYRYQREYRAVLWARADSSAVLTSDFVSIAHLLNVPEKDEQDQNRIVEAVMRWLRINSHWLLILDNVEDVAVAAPFIPLASRGHILLTTRTQALGGIAQHIKVQKMSPEMGALLLLRRASLLPSGSSLDATNGDGRTQAIEISRVLGGLPLALDQAGAYIKETPCSLSDYLTLYQARAADLLHARGGTHSDYPDSVATTWSLSFEKVTQACPPAAELLHLCAFLYPDEIPEELITDGAPHLSPVLQPVAIDPLQLDSTIKELRRFSLLHREPDTRTFTIHRLVQRVLQDRMDVDSQRQWAERTVLAVSRAFPQLEFATWPRCQRLILQVQACVPLIEQWNLGFPEAAWLLHEAGSYLEERAQYREAEQLLRRATALCEQVFGAEHPTTAASLNNLANLYREQGRYEQVEPLSVRALDIWVRVLGAKHPDTAAAFQTLAILYRIQGKYEQAEILHQLTLAIWKQTLGAEHPKVARCLNNLAALYENMGRYEEAEVCFQSALTIDEKALGLGHPDIAIDLNNLANLYSTQGKYEQAELLYRRALTLKEQTLGSEHSGTATSVNNLATIYYLQGKYEQAELLYQRVITIREKILGAEHPDTAQSLNNLAALYESQGKYEQAEPLYQQAVKIWEMALGAEHPDTAQGLNNLAELYRVWGRYKQAEPLYHRALAIRENVLGAAHPLIAESLNNLACLYYDQGKYEQAEPFYVRALTIREQVFEPEHPLIASSLNNLATVYDSQGKYEEALLLYQRALAIRERVLGPGHPDTAVSLNNLAALYSMQGEYEQAEPLYQRALAIWEETLGAEHPYTVTCLYNLLEVYEGQGKYEQAASLYQHAIAIYKPALRPDHPDLAKLQKHYAALLRKMDRRDETGKAENQDGDREEIS